MNKLILLFVLILLSFSIFAQSKVPTDKALTQLMEVKKGMNSVNTIPQEFAKIVAPENKTKLATALKNQREIMLSKAMTTFKADYTAADITFIYNEITSDKIELSDLTNGFFRKWRNIKGNYFFKQAKEFHFKFK